MKFNTIGKFTALISSSFEKGSFRRYSAFNRVHAIDAYKPVLKYLLEANLDKTSHINLKEEDVTQEDRGKFFRRYTNKDGNSSLDVVPLHHLEKYNVFGFVGVDGDSRKAMSGFLKSLENLAALQPEQTLTPEGLSLKGINPVVYCPNITRNQRFKDVMEYSTSEDRSFFSKHMEEFTRRYVMPKFLNDQGKLFFPQQIVLSLYSYSAGAREVLMLENALRTFFKYDYSCSNDDIELLFDCISAVNIGHAFDIHKAEYPAFSKVSVYFIRDKGVLIPASVFDTESVWLDKLEREKFVITYSTKDINEKNKLILLYKDVISDKNNENGHSLPSYIEGMKRVLPHSAKETILQYLMSEEYLLKELAAAQFKPGLSR